MRLRFPPVRRTSVNTCKACATSLPTQSFFLVPAWKLAYGWVDWYLFLLLLDWGHRFVWLSTFPVGQAAYYNMTRAADAGFLWWLFQTCVIDPGDEQVCHVWCCTYSSVLLRWLLLGDTRIIQPVVLTVIHISTIDDILISQLLCCEDSYIP